MSDALKVAKAVKPAKRAEKKKHPASMIPGVHVREEIHGAPIFSGRK